jgi:hypothetical protein
MRHLFTLWIIGAFAFSLSFIGSVQAQSPNNLVPAADVAAALKGKVCTTKSGATFTFTKDGHYTYDGMWTDTGHYSVHDSAVTILLDSGLEKDFVISRRDGVLYMEQTAVRCIAPREVRRSGASTSDLIFNGLLLG